MSLVAPRALRNDVRMAAQQPVLLDGDEIRELLAALADQLDPRRPQERVVIVGGALLALRGLRRSTADVDAVRELTHELRAAAHRVAAARGLASDWLNDRAAPFAPRTLEEGTCDVLWEHQRLRVLGVPSDQVILMKLYAMRDDRDAADIAALWPRSGFDTPAAAAEAFQEAYPHAPRDPYLAKLVEWITDSA